jgi:hypothetical protein
VGRIQTFTIITVWQFVHDLAGVCHSPKVGREYPGIKLQLPRSAAATVLVELGKQMLTLEKSSARTSVSPPISRSLPRAKRAGVLRVYVDLVVNPARGGEFIRQIYQKFQQSGKDLFIWPTPKPKN